MSTFKNLSRCVCCTLDLVLATRIIAFIGLVMSTMLITFLVNDKYSNNNFMLSRKTALALGVDWQHFDDRACTSQQSDPDGGIISLIVVFHSSVFLIINSLLFYATIKANWLWTIPWIIVEFLSCISKFGALVYHLVSETDLNMLFLTGSAVYIVILLWWQAVVLTSALTWKENKKMLAEYEDETFDNGSNKFELSIRTLPLSRDQLGKLELANSPNSGNNEDSSPGPYYPNQLYSVI